MENFTHNSKLLKDGTDQTDFPITGPANSTIVKSDNRCGIDVAPPHLYDDLGTLDYNLHLPPEMTDIPGIDYRLQEESLSSLHGTNDLLASPLKGSSLTQDSMSTGDNQLRPTTQRDQDFALTSSSKSNVLFMLLGSVEKHGPQCLTRSSQTESNIDTGTILSEIAPLIPPIFMNSSVFPNSHKALNESLQGPDPIKNIILSVNIPSSEQRDTMEMLMSEWGLVGEPGQENSPMANKNDDVIPPVTSQSSVLKDTDPDRNLSSALTVTSGGEPSVALNESEVTSKGSNSIHKIKISAPVGTSGADLEVSVCIEDSQSVFIGGRRRWQCVKCDKSYTTKSNLITHILDHNQIKPYNCSVCGKFFKQLSHLQTHMLTHSKNRPHSCNVCSKTFTQHSHLRRHKATHLVKKPHICELCNRGFAYPSELRVHTERHEIRGKKELHAPKKSVSPEDLKCKVCEKTFEYPSQLRDHVLKHTGARPHMCGECGMDFMKEHHLRSHQFTHTGLKPYTCLTCGKSFNQKANMTRHQYTHSNSRQFVCNVCEKAFLQPQTLKAHMIVHSNAKPYICKVCGKAFSRYNNLQGHMFLHKDGKPFECFCGSSFTLKGNYARHMRERHKMSGNESETNAVAIDRSAEIGSRSSNDTSHTEDATSIQSEAECTPKKKKRKCKPPKKNVEINYNY